MLKKLIKNLTAPTIVFTGFLFLGTSISAIAASNCNSLKGCEKKLCEIEQQLNIATEANNTYRIAGLTKALTETKKHCTDQGLKKELIEEIAEAKAEIIDYEVSLKQAEQDQKMDKIQKYQQKINEQKNTLSQLESELSSLD